MILRVIPTSSHVCLFIALSEKNVFLGMYCFFDPERFLVFLSNQ